MCSVAPLRLFYEARCLLTQVARRLGLHNRLEVVEKIHLDCAVLCLDLFFRPHWRRKLFVFSTAAIINSGCVVNGRRLLRLAQEVQKVFSVCIRL